MTTLIKRVQGHCSGQKTSGQNTLSLTGECIDHMFGESGDWTPLAYLIGRSEPAQSRAVRSITGKVVQGYNIRKDDEQAAGFRFVKDAKKNQGIDDVQRDKLGEFITAGKSVQSVDVKNWLKPASDTPVFDLQAWADRVVAAGHKNDQTLVAMKAAIEAAEERYQKKQADKK